MWRSEYRPGFVVTKRSRQSQLVSRASRELGYLGRGGLLSSVMSRLQTTQITGCNGQTQTIPCYFLTVDSLDSATDPTCKKPGAGGCCSEIRLLFRRLGGVKRQRVALQDRDE